MKKKKFVQITERDIRILKFLWRWKLISESAIAVKFFPDLHPGTAYNRMRELQLAGLTEKRADVKVRHFYWTLTQNGFNTIADDITGLGERGFASEHIRHDALATALHLGDWLVELGNISGIFSEQQLRRVRLEDYPSWVPKSEKHRPDGYWGFACESGIKPVALEMELTIKSTREYEDIVYFYDSEQRISRVLWVVSSRGTAERIKKCFLKVVRKSNGVHSFVLLEHFLESCWNANIFDGLDIGKTISEFLESQCKLPIKQAINPPKKFIKNPLLETRRSYIISQTKPNSELSAKSH